MPQVIFSSAALRDLERLRAFLRPKNPTAARRAGSAIIKTVQCLAAQPEMGRPAEDVAPGFRELLIGFGETGYVALYRFDGKTVAVMSIRHQKEVGYPAQTG